MKEQEDPLPVEERPGGGASLVAVTLVHNAPAEGGQSRLRHEDFTPALGINVVGRTGKPAAR